MFLVEKRECIRSTVTASLLFMVLTLTQKNTCQLKKIFETGYREDTVTLKHFSTILQNTSLFKR